MRKSLMAFSSLLILGCLWACATAQQHTSSQSPKRKDKVVKSDAEWKKLLTPAQYDILRAAGTEAAFSGKFHNNHVKGDYFCVGCGNKLFTSAEKFDSGTGWPSYWKPATKDAVWILKDKSFGMDRDEVRCSKCDGHLGHVFDDGPKPTGLRYCINSECLIFKKTK